ncbi:hypothetical protein [Miniphocaeibacter halophilus]|uniref:Uncharacterized protein n=1 Tax=Miniphocaeibacter halophilus TaxID=2931922 RepID=A0AC61MQV7_9FIRM|nr:hypothetical protein [Miniphocaeibacter halophilus]QQK07319.1 hypothetical protein JFY71_08330 [Miniphocaeibacter halophilus]
MKKNNLIVSLIYLILGILILISTLFYTIKYESIIFGFAFIGAGLGGGIRYIYWTRGKNIKKYEERRELREIELEDERKEHLRNISGRYTYIIGLIIIFLSFITSTIVLMLDLIEGIEILWTYLIIYLIFQYIVGVIIFKRLDKKY